MNLSRDQFCIVAVAARLIGDGARDEFFATVARYLKAAGRRPSDADVQRAVRDARLRIAERRSR